MTCYRYLAGVVIAVGVFSLASCGSDSSVSVVGDSSALPVVDEAKMPTPARISNERSYMNGTFRLGIPDAGDTPTVPAEVAIGVYQANGLRPVGKPSAAPDEILFGRYSNDSYGEVGKDGRVLPTYVGTPVWAIVYHGVANSEFGGVTPEGKPASPTGTAVGTGDFVFLVAASNGAYLNAYEGPAAS